MGAYQDPVLALSGGIRLPRLGPSHRDAPWLLSLVILCPLMLVLGLLLHAALALHALWLDIALYLGLMAFGFWFPVRFSGPFRGWRWRIPAILAFLLGALILLFTFFPPAGVLFADLS